MDYEKQIDRIKECCDQTKVGVVTVLTGKNGAGKSLIRKLLAGYISEKTGTDPAHTVASVSMESRTNKKENFSALNAAGIDDPTNPTSSESLYNIKSLVKSLSEKHPRYIVIDEPEIGMGEEMVAALVIRLNEMFETLPIGCLGVMFITHNRQLVKNIKGEFLNLESMTREEWLDREIVPTDLEQFETDSLGLFRAINARMERNRKKQQS